MIKKMLKVVFFHLGAHFEELMTMAAAQKYGGNKYLFASNAKLRYVTNPNELPGLPDGVNFSECLFIGMGKVITRQLIEAGVPEDQIIDEHEGSGRREDSSFRKLLGLLHLDGCQRMTRWADVLGQKDSGKGGDNFTVYRSLDAIYKKEMAEDCSCDGGVAWGMELALAALSCDDYFAKGERPQMAGRFFERLACAWACYRSGDMDERQVFENLFFEGWQKHPADFPQTLRRLGKDGDETLFQIIRMAKNGSQRSLNPLGLPRLLYALYEKQGLDRTIAAACKALDAEKRKQEKFLEALEIVSDAKQIPMNNGETNVLFAYSNNDQISCAARYKYGEKVGVVYQEEDFPKRSVQIFTNSQAGISLESFYEEILIEEARLEAAGGKMPEKKWHFLSGNNMDTLLNGSGSYPGVSSTLIASRWFEKNTPRLAEFRSVMQKAA
jgi:hypothetical protein